MAPLSKDQARKQAHRNGQAKAMEGRRCPECGRGNALTRTDSPGWRGKLCRYCGYSTGRWL